MQSPGTPGDQNTKPEIQVSLDGRQIIKQDFSDYLAQIADRYPPSRDSGKFGSQAQLDDLVYKLSAPEIDMMIVFSRVEIYVNAGQPTTYFLSPNTIYLKEK